ncbi:MAG: peptidylprolyl isomerase [Cyanobacteria bacterium P01_H01_bin.121]
MDVKTESAPILKFGSDTFDGAQVLNALITAQLWPRFCSDLIIDVKLATIECSEAEQAEAMATFCQAQTLTTPELQQQWCDRYHLTPQDLEAIAIRNWRLEKFKQQQFAPKVETHFLQRKSRLDRAIYSLIRVKDAGLAQELYFRLEEDPTLFPDLARQYSQGPEAATGGVQGPIPLSTPHPNLAKLLAISQAGQLWPPTRIESWHIIVRLEQLIPAQLDERMQLQMREELFNQWLQQQLATLPVQRLL